MRNILLFVLICFGCRTETDTRAEIVLREVDDLKAQESEQPTAAKQSVVEIGQEMYELGKESAEIQRSLKETTAELKQRKEELETLEMVVYFTACIERLSGKPFKEEFKRGRFNDRCKVETMSKSAEEISVAAATIMKKPPLKPSGK